MHWLSLFVLMAAACVLGLAWNSLPERWATHWSVGGQVDARANKSALTPAHRPGLSEVIGVLIPTSAS